MSATNLYTKGDICKENGAHRFFKDSLSIILTIFRSCEVRIRCRDDIVSQKVFIYMLEVVFYIYKDFVLFC